jgi:uncharacterized membrane protein
MEAERMTIKLRDARLFMLLVLLAVVALAAGCSGTRNAYKAAEGVDETAKVMTYQYTAIVHELNRMRAAGTLTGDMLARSQAAVRAGSPIMVALSMSAVTFDTANKAYRDLQSAETQAELEAATLAFQTALSAAAIQISAMIDLLQSIKGG